MKTAKLKFGMSLPEILTSIMIVALLAVLTIPAVKAIVNSFSSTGSAEAMINAALSNARAMAMKEQRYVGVRFQKANNSAGVLNAEQYMVFIANDKDATGLASGYRAIEGLQPIKMPDNTIVLDQYIVTSHNVNNPVNPGVGQQPIQTDGQIDSEPELTDASTFSIIFSPQGNLVIVGVRIRRPLNGDSSDVFNTYANVNTGTGKFYQDDYFDGTNPDLQLGPEPSRRQFWICQQDLFRKAFEQGMAYTSYLSQLFPVYINSYTGTIITTGTGQ